MFNLFSKRHYNISSRLLYLILFIKSINSRLLKLERDLKNIIPKEIVQAAHNEFNKTYSVPHYHKISWWLRSDLTIEAMLEEETRKSSNITSLGKWPINEEFAASLIVQYKRNPPFRNCVREYILETMIDNELNKF